MGSVSNCVVCSESDSSATFVPVISSRTAASDVLLAFKLFEVIGLEALDGVICSVCLDLLEQIDFFEQNAASSKEKIKQRKDRVPDKGEVRFKEEKLAEDEDEEATFDASGVVDDDVDEEEEEVVVKRRKKKRGKRSKLLGLTDECADDVINDDKNSSYFPEHSDLLENPDRCLEKLADGGVDCARLSQWERTCAEDYASAARALLAFVTTRVEYEAAILARLKYPWALTNAAAEATSKCFDCGHVFDSPDFLLRHYLGEHGRISDLYTCPICPEFKSASGQEGLHHMQKCHQEALSDSSECPIWLRGSKDSLGGILVNDCGGMKAQRFQCSDCGIVCATQLALCAHRSSEHHTEAQKLMGQHDCVECNMNFKTVQELHRHRLIRHEGYYYVCPICSNKTIVELSFKSHIRMHMKTGEMTAPRSVDEKQLKKSRAKQESQRTQCDICSLPSKTPRSLSQHKSTYHGIDTPTACRHDSCDLVFPSFREEKLHFTETHIKFRVTCDLCGKQFQGPLTLRKHMKVDHLNEVEKFICQICAKECSTKYSLQNHLRVHEEPRFQCDFCEKRFRWVGSLQTHLFSAHQTSTRTFECDVCGKVFKDKGNLKKHAYTHSSEKPFSCEKCQRGFIRKDFWKSHTASCNV